MAPASAVPVDVRRESPNERGKPSALEGMGASPGLNQLSRSKSPCQQAPEIEQREDKDQDGTADRDYGEHLHCR